MSWIHHQTAVDGWYFLFMSLNASADQNTSLMMEGLDSLQRCFWGEFSTTGKFPEGAVDHLAVLLEPLIALRSAFGPFVHEQELDDWAHWSARLDDVLKVWRDDDWTKEEKLLFAAMECVQGQSITGAPDGVPLVVLPFSLVRASRKWHDADKWWHDIVDVLAEIREAGIAGLDRLADVGGKIAKPIADSMKWLIGGLVASVLVVGVAMAMKED